MCRETPRDFCSKANYEEVTTKHIDFDWEVNFEQKILSGWAELQMLIVKDGAEKAIYDTRGLVIQEIQVQYKEGEWETVSINASNEGGSEWLTVPLNSSVVKKDDLVRVRIKYHMDPAKSGDTALCWLTPEQTDGGDHPYMFSQCQAIHCRSLMPIQDTPAVRASYRATVRAPKDLVALMSALSVGSAVEEKHHVCRFEQPVAIPSYLIAIVVGDLTSIDISPRVRVWSEPKRVEAAAHEFAETEQFVAAGENLLTPYQWGRYDVLLLPASFPYGGMENPCLTFVTPTLLAGDRSLADVIAHEVSHSWTGNLVTNRTWEDFWLNEGFTMYVQRQIVAAVRNDHRLIDFDALDGLHRLKEDVNRYGEDHPYTAMRPDFKDGGDPDDAFSSVPYEKGFNFLYYLQTKVGEPAFLAWLKEYIKTFSHKTLTSNDMKEHITTYFESQGQPDAFTDVDWAGWFDKPGMPLVIPAYSTELADESTALAKKWRDGGEGTAPSDIEGWVTGRTLAFLDTLLAGDALPESTVAKLDETYKFMSSRNSEILFRWLMLCLRSNYSQCIDQLRTFITAQGRMKYVRPLYREFYKLSPEVAQDLFKNNRHKYHNICQKMLAKDLEVDK